MEAERKHEILGPETKNFITDGSAGSMIMFGTLPLCSLCTIGIMLHEVAFAAHVDGKLWI